MMTSRSFTPLLAAPLTAAMARAIPALALVVATFAASSAFAQEQLPWGQSERSRVIEPGDRGYISGSGGSSSGGYSDRASQRDTVAQGEPSTVYPSRRSNDPRDDRDEQPPSRDYRPAAPVYPSPPDRSYGDRPQEDRAGADRPHENERYGDRGPGRPYEPAPGPAYGEREPGRPIPYARPSEREDHADSRTYSTSEINNAGHRFFGKITSGLANVIEHAFKKAGRPRGYILGEEGGGAFIAGLRYGEGILHMKDGTRQKVYWQGPSLGYDFGAEGSKTMILVYDIDHPGMIYSTFGGVSGSAYLVGGVGLTFMKNDDVTLAPIRSGIGLRLGANVGYLKYTRAPTWNPF
jgi:hypothetical protein